jgi:hypothetical protein
MYVVAPLVSHLDVVLAVKAHVRNKFANDSLLSREVSTSGSL